MTTKRCWLVGRCALVALLAGGVLAPRPAYAHRSFPSTEISDVQETGAGAGWDTITWTDLATLGYVIDVVNWEPGYHPTSNQDAGGVDTELYSGSTSVQDMQADYNIKSIFANYYNPTYLAGKTVWYVSINSNSLATGIVTAYSQTSPSLSYGY